MPTITRNSGLRITVPTTHEVSDIVIPTAQRRRKRAFGSTPLPADAISAELANEAVIEALQDQDMELVDRVEIAPVPMAPAGRKRRPRKSASTTQGLAEIQVELAPHEDAVLLLEQEGMYSWSFPTEIEDKPVRRTARGALRLSSKRRITFQIPVSTTMQAKPGMARRGLFQNFALDKVKAYVLKFVARIAVGQGIKFLERKVSKGIVRIASLDPSEWKLIDKLSALDLPNDKQARILLFVHGTFSNTIGAYGALAATPLGKSFLEGALANYDAVIGFDHVTLAEDPLANAIELLGHLEDFDWKFAPHFDVIAHSRGGLVFRSLVEHLLPLSNMQAHFDRVIFTACTNRGTLLAEPDNWRTFIDLYTNLAVASIRLIGLIPQATAVTIVLNEILQGLGAFVKYCVTVAVNEGIVPGIAAVQPKGDFIKKINEVQEGQPTIEKSHYCAITSEFEPRIFGGDHEPKELPRRFVQWIVDVFSDEIIREANDLVVDTASMTSIDPEVGNFIKDALHFGKNPQVYHTNYFVQPDVVNAMTSWLQLVQPEAKPANRSARSTAKGSPRPKMKGSKLKGKPKTKSRRTKA